MHFGTVVAVNVVRGPEGRRLGYAYIQYQEPMDAAAAVCGLHGTFIGDRDMECSLNTDGIKEQKPRFFCLFSLTEFCLNWLALLPGGHF